MNKVRRADLEEIKTKIEEIKERLEIIRDDEQDYYDNIPENLEGSERYELSGEAIDNMDSALDSFNDIVAALEAAQE